MNGHHRIGSSRWGWLLTSVVLLALSQAEYALCFCDSIIDGLVNGELSAKKAPIARFEVQPGVWLYQYAENVWGLAGEQDQGDREIQSLLFASLPTDARKDVVFLFAHGLKDWPLFSTRHPAEPVLPYTVWKKMEETGRLPKEINAVVLMSCHSGMNERAQNADLPSPAIQISAASGGAPVIAPTGKVAFEFRAVKGTPQIALPTPIRIGTLDGKPEVPWVVTHYDEHDGRKRKSKLSDGELEDIARFFINWEKKSKAAAPIVDVEPTAQRSNLP